MFHRIRAITFVSLLLATASPAITINTAVAQTQSSTKIASTVLVTVNGQQLTQSMVDSVIEVGEFLADHKFSAADKHWFKDLAIKEFRKNPTEEIQGYKIFAQLVARMKPHLGNPVTLAYEREKLISGVYLDLLAKNEVNKPSFMTIVYKYSPVLFVDPENNFVVTKRTIDSIYAPSNFVKQLVGRPIQTPNYQAMAQGFPQYNRTLSPQKRKNLATAESRWVRLQTAWSKSSPQQKQQITAFINKQLQAGHDEGDIAAYLLRNVNSQNTARNMNSLARAIQNERNIQGAAEAYSDWGRGMGTYLHNTVKW